MFLQPIDIARHPRRVGRHVAVGQFRNNPEAPVMKWGFILVTLYMGPIGLLLYDMADKEPAPGTHEEFVKPLWKQGRGVASRPS